MNGPEKESKTSISRNKHQGSLRSEAALFQVRQANERGAKMEDDYSRNFAVKLLTDFFFFFLGGGFYIGMYKERQTAFGAHSSTERQGKKEKGLAIKLTGDQELHNAKRSFFFF